MATLDETLALVSEQTSRLESLDVFVTHLEDQIKVITAGQLTPDAQAKVDAIFASVQQNKGLIDKALADNTETPPVVDLPPVVEPTPAPPAGDTSPVTTDGGGGPTEEPVDPPKGP